jgi:hypothetical protein
MDELYGLEIAEKIEEGIITEEEYLQLVEAIGEPYADQYVIPLKKRYIQPSDAELKKMKQKIKEKQTLKKGRVDTLLRIREETKVKPVLGKNIGTLDLEMVAHDDFQWDSIIYVDGHSSIDERVSDLKFYRDIARDLEVVTIASSEAGTYCLATDFAIHTLMEKIKKPLTPMEVALILNTQLREDPTFRASKEDQADAAEFLKSTVQISASTRQYYERDWNFFERSGKPSGFLFVQNESLLVSLLTDQEKQERTKLSKTEILTRALPFGRRPLFVDIGCLNYRTPRAKEIWEENYKTRGFILGGRRKLTKRPKVKKLIHFT